MIVFYKELGFHMSRGRTKPYFVLRHATSCVTAHDRYFQLPGLPSLLYIPSFLLYVTSVISPVFYITDYSMNLIFPFPPSFFLFFGFPFWFPLRIFFTFPVFPLPFPCAYARARLPNARVNIIRCTPFRLSSYIREKYVLQHPYNSTL